MANCQVTKLKTTVSADTLSALGELRVRVTTGASSHRIRFTVDGETTIRVKDGDDGFFYNETAQSTPITTLTSSSSLGIVLPDNKEFTLQVSPKYNIVKLEKPNGYEAVNNFVININDFEDCEDTTQIGLYQTEGIGNIDKLTGLSSLSALRLLYCSGVTGHIESVTNLTGLTDLELDNTAVTGSSSAVSGLTNLTTLRLRCAGMTFNDADFAHLINLTTLRVYSGTYDGIASAMVNTGGRTSGTMTLWIDAVKTITFNPSSPGGYTIS